MSTRPMGTESCLQNRWRSGLHPWFRVTAWSTKSRHRLPGHDYRNQRADLCVGRVGYLCVRMQVLTDPGDILPRRGIACRRREWTAPRGRAPQFRSWNFPDIAASMAARKRFSGALRSCQRAARRLAEPEAACQGRILIFPAGIAMAFILLDSFPAARKLLRQ